MSEKKPGVLTEIIIGLGTSFVAFVILGNCIIASQSGFRPLPAIAALITVAAFAFMIVRLYRTGHTVASAIMMVLIIPPLFLLLLTGACFVTIGIFSA